MSSVHKHRGLFMASSQICLRQSPLCSHETIEGYWYLTSLQWWNMWITGSEDILSPKKTH